MKTKRLLLLLCLLATAGSAALAEEYIQVSNKKMPFTESWTKSYSDLNDTHSGTISWDASNRKLTLNKINMWRGWELNFVNSKTCIEVYSTKNITIEVLGSNKISNGKGQTLALHGNTTFTGDGTLKLVNNDDKKPGIDLLEKDLVVTASGPKLKFECKNGGIRGKDNTGMFYVKGGEVTTSSFGKLVTGLAEVAFGQGMGVKSPQGATFSRDYHCMVDMNNKIISSQTVELDTIKYYGFRICGHEVTENNYDRINRLFCVTEGSVWFSPSTNRLVLDKATINSQTSAPTIDNYDNDGLIIQLIGENMFKFDGVDLKRDAFNLMKNTTIMSFEPGAKLYALRSGIMGIYEHAGIYVYSGKTLTLQNVSLDVAHIAGGNAYTFLNMADEAYISFRGGKDKGTVRNINVINKSKCPEVAVESNWYSPRFIWNEASVPGVYQDKNTLTGGGVVLCTKSDVDWYPLYICGHRVNSLNYDRPINEFVESGSLFYNIVTGDLDMINVTIDYYGGKEQTGPAIKWDTRNTIDNYIYSPSLCLGGTNTIKSYNGDAISCTKEISIKRLSSTSGDWSLTLVGSNAKVSTPSQLSFSKVTVTLPEISAKSLVVSNAKLSVTKKLDIKKYEHEDEVVASTPDAPAYYDIEKQMVVAPKGPVNFVPRSSVTIYPIFFCGEEVNSANAEYLINRYMKEDNIGHVWVTKESGEYDINLYWLDVNYNDFWPVFDITSTDNIKINLIGKNTFDLTNAGNNARFIQGEGNTYIESIWGNDALTVIGKQDANTGAIAVNSCLYIRKQKDRCPNICVPRIYGTGSLSKLYIDTPYLTVTGNSQGTVKDIECIVGSDAELYNTSSTPREIRSDGVYSNGSICTEDVKFVKKGESYIHVRRIEVTPTRLTLTKKGETQTLSATVVPSNATNKEVVWQSSNESVATVDQNGKVRAVGNGTARIQAFSTDEYEEEEEGTAPLSLLARDYCDVTVDIPEPTAVALDQTEVLIDRESVGGVYLTASLTPSNADTEFTWESSDTTVVTVLRTSGQRALVRRIADEGEATITVATSNGLTATCKVTIHYPITPMLVDFEQRTYTLTEAGQQIKLEPIVTPDNCEKLSFTWETSSDAISLSDDGTVTARRNGSAVVECWACYDGQKYAPGEVRIYVEIPPEPVIATNLSLPSIDPFYQLGEQFILVPTFTPENVTNDVLSWTSSDPDVATVDEEGVVTIINWGECYIKATTTDGSRITRNCWIQVIDPSTIVDPVYATGIRLEEKEITLMRGEEARIGLTIEPADYTESIMVDPLEGDISIAQVNQEWDWNTNRTCIYIRSEEWSEQSGDMKWVIRPNAVDWEKLNAMGIWEEPRDTLTIHVLAPIIFAAASPEEIDITYHVTDIKDKTCEVYTQPRPGMTMIDPLDPDLTPAVSQTATGKLTVPARANDYWVTNVMQCGFNRCSGLTEIEFSEGIETIGDYACYSGLFSLERVTLPSTIKELGQYCFSANPSDYATSEDPSGRNHIREVNIKAFTPPTGQNGSDINWSGAFHQVASDAVLYVPTGALENYNVEPWTQWFSRIAEKQFFEDQDAIRTIESSKSKVESSWYDLSGSKLGSKPAKPGLYIQNGKKIVIK